MEGTGNKSHQTTRSSKRQSGTSAAEKAPSIFLCKPRYVNELPEPPFDLKLYNIDIDTSVYAKYSVSSLESSYKPKFETGAAQDFIVDLIASHADEDCGEGEPLTELEQEIIGSDTESKRESKQPQLVPSWMRRTRYDEFSDLRTAKSTGEHAGSFIGDNEATRLSAEDVFKSIEQDFEDAKKSPVHPDSRKRHLRPTEILPILPDFENWSDKFVILQFDADPAEELERLEKTNIEEESVQTALTVAFTSQQGGRFLSYYAPTERTLEERKKELGNFSENDRRIEIYEHIKDYSFVTRPEEKNRNFIFRQVENTIRYLPISSRLFLHRRVRRQANHSIQSTPQRMVVEKRDFNETEKEERQAAINRLWRENDSITDQRQSESTAADMFEEPEEQD
eukprot:jgi/Galph1/1986/GphlegSOOS_G628.1